MHGRPPMPAAPGSATTGDTYEGQLEALVQSSPDVIFRLDRELGHLFITSNVVDLGGRPAEHFLGKTAREAGLPADASDAFEQAAREAIATGAPRQLDFAVGDAVFRTRLVPERAPDGAVRSLMGVTENVTEARRAARDAEFVGRLGQTLSSIADPDEMIRVVTQAVGEHLRCQRCYFGEIDEESGTVTVHPDWARDGLVHVAGRYRTSDFMSPALSQAVRRGSIAVEDVATDPLTSELAVKYRAAQIRALANAAFARAGRPLVHLAVEDGRPRRWRSDELALLETVTARTWPLVERARSEEALKESEERLRLALDAGRMVAWEWNARTGRTTLSDSARTVLGLPRAIEDVDTGFARIHPDDLDRHMRAVQEAVERRDGYTSEIRVIRPDDGRVIWVEDRAKVALDDQGRLVRVSGLIMDVTEKVMAEQQARRLASILEATPDFVAIARADGQLEYVNRAGRRLVGLPGASDALPRAEAICPPWAAERILHEWLPRALLEDVVSDEGALLDAGGREVPVSFVLLVHRNDGGEVEFLSTVARDISERKRTEEALRAADRRKDEFLAMLAHELRNPLAPIRNAVEILKLRGTSDPKLAWPLDVIDRQVDHLTRLVDDLLDVSRITRGRIELKKEVVDLVTVVGRAVEASRPLIDARKQHLEIVLPAETARIEGDVTRLSQVLSNLLHNAAKYTEEGGHLALHAGCEGDEVVVRVRDDGMGIAPDVLPHVFELFTQSERTLDRAQGGLGIGLTVVKRLVEMHGGRVEAASGGTGCGSEFTVRLPAVRTTSPEYADAGDERPAVIPPPADARRILVVDDNVDAAESMALLLGLGGHAVRTAHDGPSGIQAARELAPDVVVLDIGLPGMNGYEVARALREDPRLRAVILIALTGYGTTEDRGRALGAGFDHHLTKPVDPEALDALIKSLLAR